MQKELDYLDGAVKEPKRPFAAIVGGSKVSSKIGVIESLLEKCDKIIIGGGMGESRCRRWWLGGAGWLGGVGWGVTLILSGRVLIYLPILAPGCWFIIGSRPALPPKLPKSNLTHPPHHPSHSLHLLQGARPRGRRLARRGRQARPRARAGGQGQGQGRGADPAHGRRRRRQVRARRGDADRVGGGHPRRLDGPRPGALVVVCVGVFRVLGLCLLLYLLLDFIVLNPPN